MAVPEMTMDDGRWTNVESHTMAEIVDAVFSSFGVEPHKDLDQSKVRSMMIEAAAIAAGQAWTQRAMVLIVQPGDVLLVRASQRMPFAAVDRLRQQLLEQLQPFGLRDVLISNVIDGVTVVRKGGEEG